MHWILPQNFPFSTALLQKLERLAWGGNLSAFNITFFGSAYLYE